VYFIADQYNNLSDVDYFLINIYSCFVVFLTILDCLKHILKLSKVNVNWFLWNYSGKIMKILKMRLVREFFF